MRWNADIHVGVIGGFLMLDLVGLSCFELLLCVSLLLNLNVGARVTGRGLHVKYQLEEFQFPLLKRRVGDLAGNVAGGYE